MDEKELIKKRIQYNKKCLDLIEYYLTINPYMRIEQTIACLDAIGDYFSEEPWVTYDRWINSKYFKDGREGD